MSRFLSLFTSTSTHPVKRVMACVKGILVPGSHPPAACDSNTLIVSGWVDVSIHTKSAIPSPFKSPAAIAAGSDVSGILYESLKFCAREQDAETAREINARRAVRSA